MRAYTLEHATDPDLTRILAERVAHDCASTAELLVAIAEFDARRLYVPAGYPSMFAYCVSVLRFSDDAAYKRIQAARAARQFPGIFPAVAEGRLHLTGVVLLKPYLSRESADELLAAAEHKTKTEIGDLIARRFPRSELLAWVQPIANRPAASQLVPEPVGTPTRQLVPEPVEAPTRQLVPEPVEKSGSVRVSRGPLGASSSIQANGCAAARAERAKVLPLALERYALQLTIDKSTHEMLCHAQALLSHAVPSGDMAEVLKRALACLIGQLEKRKFAATEKPRPRACRSTADRRHIPAHVRRAVWARDGGQCTYVSPTGHRCPARTLIEFDHVDPVARGGRATVEGIRLRCRTHNQYEAELTFGAEFMKNRRDEARRAAEARARAGKARIPGYPADPGPRRVDVRVIASNAARNEHATDLMSGLRNLGFRAEQVRRAAAFCATMTDATLEEQAKAALRFLCPRARSQALTTNPAAPA